MNTSTNHLTPIRCNITGARRGSTGGFSIVELLVVITIVAMIITILLPSMQSARRVARITACAANMRSQGQFFQYYSADCKDWLPFPTTPHRLRGGVSQSLMGGGFSVITVGSVGNGCPDNPGANPRAFPVGFGLFYYMGYLPPVPYIPYPKKAAKISSILVCPDAPTYRTSGTNIAQFEEDSYRSISQVSQDFAVRNMLGVNPFSANWDCTEGSHGLSYAYRGWYQVNGLNAASNKIDPKASNWSPARILALDEEFVDYVAAPSYSKEMDVHGDGLNLLFHDGHVNFGGKNINGYRPSAYFSMTYDGQTPFNAYTYSISEICVNIVGGSQNIASNGNLRMWQYYEGW